MKPKIIQLLLVIVFAATFTSCVAPYYVHDQRRAPRERYHQPRYERHHYDRHHSRH